MASTKRYKFLQTLSLPGIISTPDSNIIFNATPNHIIFKGTIDFTDATFIGLPDGGVSGPTISIINAVPRFSGTTGKMIKNSNVIIDDSGNITCNSIKIGSNTVLTGNSLGVNIVSSSLTSVGVLQNLQVDNLLFDENIIGTINNVDLHINSPSIYFDDFNSPDSYLFITNDFKIIAASNSIHLKSINQDLSTTSTPTFTSITGVLTTPSQTNITNVGTLTSLTISGNTILSSITPNSILSIDGTSKIIVAPNSTQLAEIDQSLSTLSSPTFQSISASFILSSEIRSSSGNIYLIPNSSFLNKRFTLNVNENIASIDGNGVDIFVGNTSDDTGLITPHITANNLTANSYIITNGQKKLVTASNSSHLSSINQSLAIGSNVNFGQTTVSEITIGQMYITDNLISHTLGSITISPIMSLKLNSVVEFNLLNANTYLTLNGFKQVNSASNSSNLASINQNLSTLSNVTFAGINSTSDIILSGDKIIRFRNDFPGDINYAMHWLSSTWDLRVILDKDTISARGISFGHYTNNDLTDTWNEYVQIKNSGTISLGSAVNTSSYLVTDSNKNITHASNSSHLASITTGTYTATFSGSNITIDNNRPSSYYRVGNMCTIISEPIITTSSSSSELTLNMSLPFASAFTESSQLIGSMSIADQSFVYGKISGDTWLNTAVITFYTSSTINNTSVSIHFTYVII